MNGYLLDTHTFLWTLIDPKKLPAKVFAQTQDPESEVFLSAVSLWEIALKASKGKLDLRGVGLDELIGLASEMGIATLSLSPEEAISQAHLADTTHYDPFDRMLIWQAILRGLTLVSGDTEFVRFKKYGLKLLWK